MKRTIVAAVLIFGLISALGYYAAPVATPVPGLTPVVTMLESTPLAHDSTRHLATWTIGFPKGVEIQPAVSHAEARHIQVTVGPMVMITDREQTFEAGQTVVIPAGTMHQWRPLGRNDGELRATGVVTVDKLHDACGAP